MVTSLNELKAERVIEALLFTSPEPISIRDLKKVLPQEADIEGIINGLQKQYKNRGINVKWVGKSIVLRTAKDLDYLFLTKKVNKRNLSRAAKETLAIIAYHQPVTKLEIEDIRGVGVGSGTIDLLMELGWIKFGRRKSSPGRPLTFQVTDKFLDHFDLASVKDLPGVKELRDLGMLAKKLKQD